MGRVPFAEVVYLADQTSIFLDEGGGGMNEGAQRCIGGVMEGEARK